MPRTPRTSADHATPAPESPDAAMDVSGAAGDLTIHPLAEAFPRMRDSEYEDLLASIRDNGQREPIIVHREEVLDGRHRLQACRELGIAPRVEQWDGRGSMAQLIWDRNALRRHLTASQRALAAVPIQQGLREEARANMSRGGQGSTDLSPLHSRAEAARMARVSEGLMAQALRVSARGNPGLVEAVQSGTLKLGPADVLLTLGEEELEAVIARGPAAMRSQAAELRREQRPRPRAGGDEDGPPSAPETSGTGSHDVGSARDAVARLAAEPLGGRGSAEPGEGERPAEPAEAEGAGGVATPDVLGSAATGHEDPGAGPSGDGPARTNVTSARRTRPASGRAPVAPPDAGPRASIPEGGAEALAEKSRLDPEGHFTDGEWVRLWKIRCRLRPRGQKLFDTWVGVYGRVRPAIEQLRGEVRLDRNDIRIIECFGNAPYPDVSPGSVLGPAASLLPPWRWKRCKGCQGKGRRRTDSTGPRPSYEDCEQCSGRGFHATTTPRKLGTWTAQHHPWAPAAGLQERLVRERVAGAQTSAPGPEVAAGRR